MNHIFNIVWSRSLGAWVVVSELATRRGKGGGGVKPAASECVLEHDRVEDAPSMPAWPLRLGMLLALLALYAPARAADRWWDPNNTAVGFGGTGAWNTASAFWSPNNDGVSGPYSAWNNAALDDAFFGGTAGTVTLGAPITVHNLSFVANGYTLGGSVLTLAGTAPTINTGDGAVSQTINSIIAGSSGLTKAGTGNLFLNGANTFTGGVNLNAGRLLVNGDTALGSGSNGITAAGGTWLTATGALASSRIISVVGGALRISGAGAGTAFFTGAGGVTVDRGASMTNDANNYAGVTTFNCQDGNSNFSSIGNLGEASALGAPTTAVNGRITLCSFGQASNFVSYTGDGDSSNRDWLLRPFGNVSAGTLQNAGTGTLTLTGNIDVGVQGDAGSRFLASTGDLKLLGVISSSSNIRSIFFQTAAGRTITLGDTNTFAHRPVIRGAGTTIIGTLADSGIASSLGTGDTILIDTSGTLSYTGDGDVSNRTWTLSTGTLNNDGTGALVLSGTMATAGTATLGGSFTGADNTFSGIISGTGSLHSAGAAAWTITAANTYTGDTIVDGGTLRAGNAQAFGVMNDVRVNGGTLDLNDFSMSFPTLSGTGGSLDLGSGTLTLQAAPGVSTTYAGSIAGSGGLTKLGASSQTLTGANAYTGATTIGGGALNLDFRAADAPASDILSSASTLHMAGGVLNVAGAAGEANTQTFNGLNISAGNNVIDAASDAGGTMTVNLGAITRTGGLMDFRLPGAGNITTTNATLGGWATVNGTDYAKVAGGNIAAFTDADYTDKDDATTWLDNEFITDIDGFFGSVGGSVQLGGLRYSVPVSTTVTVAPGQTLGVDGTIIVAPSVAAFDQTITGGFVTGAAGGESLGIQQNSAGNFTIASQVVDNGGSLGFTKAGTGLVTLGNANNSYTGATRVVQGTLSVGDIDNGGVASGIGASSADSSNLLLEGAMLRYTGATTSSDRGFTLAKSGGILGSGIEVANAGSNLTFSGQVISADGANFTKSGAGTLTLANDGNTYTGITTVTGGLLSVDTLADGGMASGIGASGSASANLVLDGGGLQYTGGTVTTDRGFTFGSNGGRIDIGDAATTLTAVGTAAGTGGFTKSGAGALVLSGANTYTGANTVSGGTLRAGSTQAFGAVGRPTTLANTSGVTLDLNDFNNTIGPLSGGGPVGGSVTLGSATLTIISGNATYAGTISGTGGVTRTGGGTQTFTGCNNSYTGPTTLSGAAMSVNCLANGGMASGIGASGNASTNLVFNSGTLSYTGITVITDRGFQLQGGAGTVGVTNAATTLTFAGTVIGGGQLQKAGTGTLVLTANNSYTGGTHVTGGTLRAASLAAFGSGGMSLDNTVGVLLNLDGFNNTLGFLSGGGTNGGNVALDSATLTLNFAGAGGVAGYGGAINGSGGLIKTGNATFLQALSGCNSSYTGPTVINSGVLQVTCLENGGANSSMGASASDPANLVLNGGILRYAGTGDSTDRQLTLGIAGGTLDASGTGLIDFSSTAPVTLSGTNAARMLTLTGPNAGDNVFSPQLTNNGTGITSLTKTGTGTWRLTNNNSTYTGVTRINGGVLSVDQLADGGLASSIGASSNAAANLVIGNGSTLRYTGSGESTDRLFTLDTGVTFIESSGSGAIVFDNTAPVTLTGTNTARTIALGGTNLGLNTLGGAIGNNGTGATTLAKNDTGTWVLTGNNTYTGNTVINNGNLMIGNGGTSGNAGAGNVIVDSATSTLSINRSDTFAFNGTLSGPGTLAQIGAGTATLTSANNSIGATAISAGTLDVDGVLATPTIAMSGAGNLSVDGTVQAAGGTQSLITGDTGTNTIDVNDGAVLRANGDLVGGDDIVTVAGTLDTGAAALNLGVGDDGLTLRDGAVIAGTGIDAGGGTIDELVIDNAAAFAYSGAGVSGFEMLTKQNNGVLTTLGVQAFSAGTAIDGGTLDVDGSLTTPIVTIADNSTLNVDGTVAAAGPAPTTITGSAGLNTIVVNATATLNANGDLGDGSDAVIVAGTLDTGASALSLGDGDDTFTLSDGVFMAGTGLDGAGGNDVLVLDSVFALTFDGGQAAGFETLLKQNAGSATMVGSQGFGAGATVAGGVLDVDGTLETPTVGLADGTALNVDGTLQAAGATQATISGSTGDNTVAVGAGGSLLASGDLGTGKDVLDVAGALDTGAGVFALGDGDDTLTIHENTRIVGTVTAGAGNDTFDVHIDTIAELGAVQGFETLSKTGTGELDINGPMSSDFTTVDVLQGRLDVTAAGIVVPAPGGTLATTVAGGATLNVDGSYGCGTGSDTMAVAGTVTGAGTIDLCDGDDTLTLRDGAALGIVISAGLGTNDTLVLDNAGALTLDADNTTNFETLRKDNTGIATVIGTQAFTGGATITGGTLDVDGSLETPTIDLADGAGLNVDGIVLAPGPTLTAIAGSAGVNTVTVGVDGTLLATGDLGAGADVLDIAGILDPGGGVFALGDGDDNFIVHDGTLVLGTVDGGSGLDTRTYDINTSASLGALANFEGVTKTGTGVLNLMGPGATDLQDVQVLAGTLDVFAGASVVASAGSALNTTVAGGATLNVDGDYGCGAGADTLAVSGTVSGSGTIRLCDGDDALTLNDGADLSGLSNPIDAGTGTGDTVVLDNAGAVTLSAGTIANFEALQKDNVGEATLTGTHSFSGGTVLNAGVLTADDTLETPIVSMGDGSVLNIDGRLEAGAGTAAVITGSVGINTVEVAEGALLIASGDLGDGADILSVAGTLDSDGGVFSLGAGDDSFLVFDATDTSNATIDGGLGNDRLGVDVGAGNTVPLGGLLGFESLGKSGDGTLEIQGPSTFIDVDVNDGTLRVTGTGGIGAVTTTILGGATLELVDGGNYSGTGSSDTFTVAGRIVGTGSNLGTIDLGDGDDAFTVQDGADLSGLAQPVSGGAGADTFTADLAGIATLGGAVGFETLTKAKTGTLIVAGPAASEFTTVSVDGGTLDVGAAGSLTGVQDATVATGATLNVDGAFGFTAGADTFVVAGTIDGVGSIDMLDGDDALTLRDGADLSTLSESIDGGTGSDTLTADLTGTATLGGATAFETLTKANVGTLIVAGPASSDFTTVNVDGGMLDVGIAGDISGVVTTTVAGGATLNVEGIFAGSSGNDTMTVSGAVGGTGTIAFHDSDDVLTLNDGADLSGFAGVLDGGAPSSSDTVVLNNAGALTFGAGTVVNFEFLSKTNTGIATLVGTQSFSGGTSLGDGGLLIEGALSTPTVAMADDTALTIAGSLDAGSGAATSITGSAGVNTVAVAGTALATGDLGAGQDVLDIVGTLDTTGGGFALGDGDDSFVVHDGTVVLGTVDGGAGLDTRVYDIDLTADLGALVNFEGVTKTGTGVLNITGPDTTDLQQVGVLEGTLDIAAAAGVVAIAGGPLDTVIARGASLNVDGHYGCGDSDDTMTVAGTVSGAGTVDLCGGEDVLTLQDGAVLANVVSGGGHGSGDTVVLDNAGALAFDAANTIQFEFLRKDNAGEAMLTGNQSFTGGTILDGGTLTIAGQLETPTVTLGDATVLAVDGTLQAGGGAAANLSGSAGDNTVTVAGTLRATGDLGEGADVLDVAGTLDTAGTVFALGGGDDTLTVHDGTTILGAVAAGDGDDTLDTDIAVGADLGAAQQFETLRKTGVGVLNVTGPMDSDFNTVDVRDGTLNIAAAGSVSAQSTMVAANAILAVQGSFTGTDGDDSFVSMGTVTGALAFGTGTDTVDFIGGNVGGVTTLDGGGGTDRLGFGNLVLDGDSLPALAGWERVELRSGSELTLGRALDLGGGVLAIDATSQLLAHAGAGIAGSVENAGLIDVGAHRLPVRGHYTSLDGALRLTVSPGTLSAGGLDIDGDVRGATHVTFTGDGSDVGGGGTASILVISSPNDDAATSGSFEPVDDVIRLDGSVFPWTFGQQADHNWYLSAESGLLPEVPAFAVLPSLGAMLATQNDDLVYQRLAAARGFQQSECERKRDERADRAGPMLLDGCHGFWAAATASELELGANPGFEVSGDDVGVFVGLDGAQERGDRTLRAGGYLGFLHGVYWTTGVNSTDLPGISATRVALDTPVGGMYASNQWGNGTYVDLVLTGQRPRAYLRTEDGFSERVTGNSLTLSARVGRSYRLDSGWTLEPQLQVSASPVHWEDMVDASGKELVLEDDVIGTARAALRVEKAFTTVAGAVIKPWAILAVRNVIGEEENSLTLVQPGALSTAQVFPNHDLGTSARLDLGVEAEVSKSVSWFGVLSVEQDLDGSDYEQRSANIGVQVRW